MKTKALISFAVTAKLNCTFVFAQAFCWFSYAVAHLPNRVRVRVQCSVVCGSEFSVLSTTGT